MRKSFLGRDFQDYAELLLERDADGLPIEHAPQERYSKAGSSRLHRYGAGTFCRFRIPGLPHESGVYIFLEDDRPVYVGKAVDLFKRFYMGYGNVSPKNCFEGGQQTNCRVNQLVLGSVRQGRAVRVLVHTCHDQDSFEAALIAHLSPIWNLAR